jgi:hypothetical protein
LTLFGATVVLAWWYRWETADLAWGLWISSLTLGYSYLIVSILGSFFKDSTAPVIKVSQRSPLNKFSSATQNSVYVMCLAIFIILMLGINRYTLLFLALTSFCALIGIIPDYLEKHGRPVKPRFLLGLFKMIQGLPLALFMLFFFSIHFLGFHLIHSMFLNVFFPRVNPSDLFSSFETGFHLYKSFLLGLLSQYWIFILFSGLSRLPDYVRAFRSSGATSSMMRPYVNVARMHVMIILFGFLYALNLQGAMLYLLLFFYFFPTGTLLREWLQKRKK